MKLLRRCTRLRIQGNSIARRPSLLRRHRTSNMLLPRFARRALAVNAVLDAGQHSVHFLDAEICILEIQRPTAAKRTVWIFKPPCGIFFGLEDLCGMSVHAGETEYAVRFVRR